MATGLPCGTMVGAEGISPRELAAIEGAPSHLRELEISPTPGDDVVLAGPVPSFVKVWLQGRPEKQLEFSFNTDATEVKLHLGNEKPEKLHFLLAEKTVTYRDGVVVLSALDAEVVGNQAKLETHPGSHRIGFWNKASDYVAWDYVIPPGDYRAELVYSRASPTGTRVTIAVGDKKFPLVLEKTGSWYRYRTIPLGSLTMTNEGKTRVEVRVDKIINGGVMNLKAIILTPEKDATNNFIRIPNNGSTKKLTASTVSYSDDIRPILSDRCFLCHGPDEASRQADLRLDLREEAISWAIVPGDAEGSEVISKVLSEEADVQMPPPESHKPRLTVTEIENLKRWINEGAVYEQHWAFVPPKRSTLPQVSRDDWQENPIDRFVLAKLDAKGIEPSPKADKRTLLRRASLDLIGLPPTREQIADFVSDISPDAWSRALDRLLASPSYGEHQARYWLDIARYADSNGYQYDFKREQWAWRDWVIAALNANMPFDQFTIEQLAGDLLPDSTPSQRLATGFNRNHPITVEGGVIDEEYRVEYVLDRTITAGSAWLGLTLGCARCHSHKYDPLSQKEFYQLSAFFNQVPERGKSGFEPKERLFSRLQQGKIEAAQFSVNAAEARFQKAYAESLPEDEVVGRMVEMPVEGDWVAAPIESKKSKRQATLKALDDGTITVTGNNPDKDEYELVFKCDGRPIGAIKVEVLPSGDEQRVGRSHNGNFVLSEATLGVSTVQIRNQFKPIGFRSAYADYSQPNFEIGYAIDGQVDSRGWAVDGGVNEPRTAIFVPRKTLAPAKDARVRLQLKFESSYPGHQFGKFRVTFCESAEPALSMIARQAYETPEDQRTDEQRARLANWVTKQHVINGTAGSEVARAYESLVGARRLHDELLADVPETMVMKDLEKPRGAYVLERGEYDKRREHVQPDTPAALPPLPVGAPRNRLGLAQWLTMRENPLTSRVTVNRLWIQLFGLGLVDTPEDFGMQSSPPSHPKLLDWLAIEFVDSGWDVKRLLKTIMLSQTYQQSSAVTSDQHAADPVNRSLARGPRMRLDAETIRDSALAVGGLLNREIGGPSVFPYHPTGLWKEVNNRPGYSSTYKQDVGDKLHRRSMYTYWKRAVPPPSMVTFDAPTREYCVMSRSRTNTPLQAFVLLHDPQYLEAARSLAGRMLTEGGASVSEQIAYGFELTVGRKPEEVEHDILQQTFENRLAQYQREPSQAEQVLNIGESRRYERLSSSEHAAMTTVARLLLNLSEFITKG